MQKYSTIIGVIELRQSGIGVADFMSSLVTAHEISNR